MDREVGVYAATRVLARTPELVLLPIGSVLFPLASRSLAQNDLRQVRHYIKGAMRVLWLVLLPTVVLVAIDAGPILRLFFPEATTAAVVFESSDVWLWAFDHFGRSAFAFQSARRLLYDGGYWAGHGRGPAPAGVYSDSEYGTIGAASSFALT